VLPNEKKRTVSNPCSPSPHPSSAKAQPSHKDAVVAVWALARSFKKPESKWDVAMYVAFQFPRMVPEMGDKGRARWRKSFYLLLKETDASLESTIPKIPSQNVLEKLPAM